MDIPFLQGKLDNNPGLFLLDSGAPHLILNSARMAKDGMESGEGFMGAVGKVQNAKTQFGELSFGDWRIGPMQVLALDESHLEQSFGVEFAGLIGFRELIHYDWLVDYGKKELQLWHSFDNKTAKIRQVTRIKYLNHLPVFEVEIAGKPYTFILDTGASGIVFDVQKKDDLSSELNDLHEDKLIGAGGKSVDVNGGNLPLFHIGEIEIQDSEVKFADLSPLQERIGDFDAIIGSPLLSKVNTVVSWERKRLFFLED